MRSHFILRGYLAALLCGLITCLPASAATIVYPAGTTIIFTPSSTLPGMRLAPVTDDPSTLQNGDIWYKTGVGFRGRSEGATITLGSGGSGTAAGLIYITNDAGTTTNYNPSADTDAARGTALLAAVAAATAGQTVKVGAGTFALAASRLLIPDDVSLDLDPATLITGTANLSTVGPIVRPGNRSTVHGGKIQGTAASGVSQAPFGISSFVASPDTSAVDFVLDGVTLEADSDAFYILSNEACTGTIRNCTFVSKYDIIYVSGYNGDPASHVVRIYNTRGIVVGPSSIASPLGRGTTIAYGATVDIHGGSLAVSDGGTTLNAGTASYEGGTLNLYGVKITTSNGANPNYDLYTNGSGVIRVNGGAGSGTGGIFSSNSGANVTYTGNLSTGGNGTADNAKQAVYGTGGILDATTEITVQNASTTAHAYLTDDGTVGFHAAGETNPRELTFPDDVLENQAKIIATREWIASQGYGTGSVATDAIWDAAGDLVYGTGANTASRLAKGTAGQLLQMNSGATAPEWTSTATLSSLSATAASIGSIEFEGATADAFETTVAVVDPTADRTFTIPNASGTAILTASNVAQAVDLGGDTSFEVPNGAAPTVDAFGEIAGDNNLWATGRGAPIFYDGTASTALINVLVSDTPTNGQVPVWNTGGTITWEANGSGSVATDTIFDAKGDLAVGTGANTSAKLTAGTNGYVLTADSAEATGLKWAAAGSGSSPTTTRGDLIRRGASADERLAVGSLGQQFMTDGTDPQWRGRNQYIDIFDEFMWGSVTAAANNGFGFASSGTIAMAASVEQGRPGVATIQAGTGISDNARLNTGASSIALGGGAFRFETSIKTPAALSDATDEYDLRVGLGDAVGAYTDGVYFEYDRNSSTNWVCGAAKAGATTENAGGSPVAVAADTWYKLKILVNANASEAQYYINDTLIYTNSASNIPNTTSNLCGFYFIIVKSAGTTTKSFSVDYAEAQFDLTTAR